MGTWGIEPWESDFAADWFPTFFDKTKIDKIIEDTLNRDVLEYYEEIRAAALILIGIGREGIWPIEKLQPQLELAISKLQEMLDCQNCPFNESPEIREKIISEINILKSRLQNL